MMHGAYNVKLISETTTQIVAIIVHHDRNNKSSASYSEGPDFISYSGAGCLSLYTLLRSLSVPTETTLNCPK